MQHSTPPSDYLLPANISLLVCPRKEAPQPPPRRLERFGDVGNGTVGPRPSRADINAR